MYMVSKLLSSIVNQNKGNKKKQYTSAFADTRELKNNKYR